MYCFVSRKAMTPAGPKVAPRGGEGINPVERAQPRYYMPRTSAGSLALRVRSRSQETQSPRGPTTTHSAGLPASGIRLEPSQDPDQRPKWPCRYLGGCQDALHIRVTNLSLESRLTRYGGASAAALNRTSLFTMALTDTYVSVCP